MQNNTEQTLFLVRREDGVLLTDSSGKPKTYKSKQGAQAKADARNVLGIRYHKVVEVEPGQSID